MILRTSIHPQPRRITDKPKSLPPKACRPPAQFFWAGGIYIYPRHHQSNSYLEDFDKLLNKEHIHRHFYKL